jgi:hypothetical protein
VSIGPQTPLESPSNADRRCAKCGGPTWAVRTGSLYAHAGLSPGECSASRATLAALEPIRAKAPVLDWRVMTSEVVRAWPAGIRRTSRRLCLAAAWLVVVRGYEWWRAEIEARRLESRIRRGRSKRRRLTERPALGRFRFWIAAHVANLRMRLSEGSIRKWLSRYRVWGLAGLIDSRGRPTERRQPAEPTLWRRLVGRARSGESVRRVWTELADLAARTGAEWPSLRSAQLRIREVRAGWKRKRQPRRRLPS